MLYQDQDYGFSVEFPDDTPEPQAQQAVAQARQHHAKQQQLHQTLGWMGQAVSGFQPQQRPMIPSKAAAAAMGPQAFQQNVASQQQQIQFEQQQQQGDRIEQERMRFRDKELLQRQKDDRNRFTLQKNQYDLQQKRQQFVEKQATDKQAREEKDATREAREGSLVRGPGYSTNQMRFDPNGNVIVTPVTDPVYRPTGGSSGGSTGSAPSALTGSSAAYAAQIIRLNNPGATQEELDVLAVNQGLPEGTFITPAQTPEDRQYDIEDIFLRSKEAIGGKPWALQEADDTYRTRIFNWMVANGASRHEASLRLDKEKIWDDLNPGGWGKGDGQQIGHETYEPNYQEQQGASPVSAVFPSSVEGEQNVEGEQEQEPPPGTVLVDDDGNKVKFLGGDPSLKANWKQF